MANDEYVPKNLLKMVTELDIKESVCRNILKYAPLGTITHKDIKKFMAVMGEAHKEYVRARVENLSYIETDNLIVPYYNKAFKVLIRLILTIIYNNARTRRYASELFSDMYMHLVVWRDFFTKRRGLTKIVTAIFNATKGELVIDNLDKADRVINNFICFLLAGRVNNYEAKERIHYTINLNSEDHEYYAAQEIFGHRQLFNPYYKMELLINRELLVDKLLALPYSIKNIRIDRALFDRIMRNYLKVFILGDKKSVIDMSKFEVAYTIYKIKQCVMYTDADVDMIKGYDSTNTYTPIYPSFTQLLANRLGVDYAD
jgi:hypothetical protein